jgi:hypothetical protein
VHSAAELDVVKAVLKVELSVELTVCETVDLSVVWTVLMKAGSTDLNSVGTTEYLKEAWKVDLWVVAMVSH